MPGPLNAITDVAGVRVGHATLIAATAARDGHGPVRTGVTVICPRDGNVGTEPVFAGVHRLNGNGEMTGLDVDRGVGPARRRRSCITNTHSVGVVRDALIAYEVERAAGRRRLLGAAGRRRDLGRRAQRHHGFHVPRRARFAALAGRAAGPVAEGNVGGGTGMICHEFKGGIGTASRGSARTAATRWACWSRPTTAAATLRVDGVPVGRRSRRGRRPGRRRAAAGRTGSIIVIVATDAPLLPLPVRRLAQRAALGLARDRRRRRELQRRPLPRLRHRQPRRPADLDAATPPCPTCGRCRTRP